jgi:isopenicillin-N N-acyltransferase-like protein
MIDCNFPIIKYKLGHSYYEWGLEHGKQFKDAIGELCNIRRKLMLKRNPSLEGSITSLAKEQFEVTKSFDSNLAEELRGIAEGANLSIEDIVILNNYTDFRDIQLPDEGCSTVQIQNEENILSGQTWDMHRSAKNYMCLIEIPKTEHNPQTLMLSLVGCTGLMGINEHSCLVGVNNINTLNAEVGLIWPNLVRKVLMCDNLSQMRTTLLEAPVTSGHNYLISTMDGAEHWEITPEFKDLIHAHTKGEIGSSFHTNHCLGQQVSTIQDPNHVSLTTHKRYEILEDQVKTISNFEGLKDLFQSHDGHPTSICTHLETGSDDPSATCGGGMMELNSKKIQFWRGCPKYDDNYIEYEYFIDENIIKKRE